MAPSGSEPKENTEEDICVNFGVETLLLPIFPLKSKIHTHKWPYLKGDTSSKPIICWYLCLFSRVSQFLYDSCHAWRSKDSTTWRSKDLHPWCWISLPAPFLTFFCTKKSSTAETPGSKHGSPCEKLTWHWKIPAFLGEKYTSSNSGVFHCHVTFPGEKDPKNPRFFIVAKVEV